MPCGWDTGQYCELLAVRNDSLYTLEFRLNILTFYVKLLQWNSLKKVNKVKIAAWKSRQITKVRKIHQKMVWFVQKVKCGIWIGCKSDHLYFYWHLRKNHRSMLTLRSQIWIFGNYFWYMTKTLFENKTLKSIVGSFLWFFSTDPAYIYITGCHASYLKGFWKGF